MKQVKNLKVGDTLYRSDAYFVNVSIAQVVEVQVGQGGSYYIRYEFCNSHQVEWAVGWDGSCTEVENDEYGSMLYFSKEALLNGINKAIDKLRKLGDNI